MTKRRRSKIGGAAIALAALLCVPLAAQALPVFNRQTGQNCQACHLGGQFPELTAYGRLFKMTGYTIGQRAFPLAVMGVLTYAKVANTSKTADPPADFAKNGAPIFATGSLFAAGKVTDNIGLFAQMTYDNYAQNSVTPDGSNGYFQGHTSADNIDIRWADHFINNAGKDLIVGVSVNNNPSVVDPWNTVPAWIQYVPPGSAGAYQFADANTPFPGFGPDQVAGVSAYLFWKKTVYAELGTYQTANGGWSFMSTGTPDSDTSKLQGSDNPYWRFALSRDWGPNSLMVGTYGMVAHQYDGADTSDPTTLGRIKTQALDAQYQYLLDPHTVTAKFVYQRQTNDYSADTLAGAGAPAGTSDNTTLLRTSAVYTYRATYGGKLSFFNLTGSNNIGNGDPATRGWTYEAFWLPIQNVRIGAQYTMYDKFNGASDNYDGAGRNAKDNDTLFFYVWGAY